MVFDPDGGGNRALKQPHPIDAAAYRVRRLDRADRRDDHRRPVGDRASSPAAAGRRAGTCGSRPATSAAVKLLTDRGYKAKFPTAKTMVRHPLARFDGSLELDDARLDVDGWTGSVNHNWGRRHTPAYAFGQVCGFDDAPESSLEIVTAHAAVGPISLPAATLFVLRHDGREIAVRSSWPPATPAASTGRSAGRSARASRASRWTERSVRESGDVIGLTYTDTDGESKYCYNSALATCRIRLSGTALTTTELTATRRGDVRDSDRRAATARSDCWPKSSGS